MPRYRAIILLLAGSLALSAAFCPAFAENWAERVSQLRTQLSSSPNNPKIQSNLALALHNRGIDFANQGAWDEAIADIKEGVGLAPGEILLRKDLAQVLLGKAIHLYNNLFAGKFNESIGKEIKQLAQSALDVNPGLAMAHALIGDVEYGLRNEKEAREEWQKAADADPSLEGMDSRFALLESRPVKNNKTASARLPGGSPSESPGDSRDWPEIIADLRARLQQSPDNESITVELADALHLYGLDLTYQGQWKEAVAQMEEALRLNPEDSLLIANLSQAYLGVAVELHYNLEKSNNPRRDEDKARRLILKSIAKNPDKPEAYLLLGDIEYDNQNMSKAKKAWKKAENLNPNLQGLQIRLDKINDEYDAEVNMKEIGTADFILKYEEEVKSSFGFDVKKKLRNARRIVGQEFDYWPERKIVVLLYSMETYRKVSREAPAWSGGLYDGKIRIPVPTTAAEASTIEGTIVHEYAHAIVGFISGGNCPPWLNEGLAEFMEAKVSQDNYMETVKKAAKENRLIPWDRLDAQFRNSSPFAAQLGYDQAHSMISYLSSRYSFWQVKQTLEKLALGDDLKTALKKAFNTSQDNLEKNWKHWIKRK